MVREFAIYTCTLFYLKWIINKDLLYSTGNSVQCYGAAWMGGEFEGNGYMYMHGWVPLLFTWNYHNTVNQLYPNTKEKVLKKNKKCFSLLIPLPLVSQNIPAIVLGNLLWKNSSYTELQKDKYFCVWKNVLFTSGIHNPQRFTSFALFHFQFNHWNKMETDLLMVLGRFSHVRL